jgi:hypothetical protein
MEPGLILVLGVPASVLMFCLGWILAGMTHDQGSR